MTREFQNFESAEERLRIWEALNRLLEAIASAETAEERDLLIQQLLALIPKEWRDEQFEEELEEAKVVEKVVIPAKFAGVEVLNNPNIPPMEEEVETYDWDAVLQAILALFSRRRRLEAERIREVVIYD